MSRLLALLRHYDIYLLGLSLLLVSVGFLMIYSTTLTDYQGPNLLFRQLIYGGAGLTLLVIFSSFHYRALQRISLWLYIIGIVLLAGLFLFALPLQGSTRWYDLGFFLFQPVEYMKLALILYLAEFFRKHHGVMGNFRYVLLSLLIAVIPAGLTLMQPDLGSAATLLFIWFGMLLVARVNKRHLLWLLLIFVVVSSVAWFYVLADYQKDRVYTFLDPSADPQGAGYNTLQAITAVGSGGLFGRGFARGVVSQLRFLPERQTDFIFASLAEELGFLGAGFLFTLLVVWFMRMVKITGSARDNYGLFAASGIMAYFFTQTTINIGMNIGLLPITGIPLPLISYGGSSLIISLVSIGILQSIRIRSQPVRFD